jgi:hypothetical protein
MTFRSAAPVLAVALLALTPEGYQVAQTPNTSPLSGANRMPSQEQLDEARITTLEAQVTQLQADVKTLKNHAHQYLRSKGPSTYMSIHDLSIAMQPHSATPTTQYFIPLTLSTSGSVGLDGIQAFTTGPMTPP